MPSKNIFVRYHGGPFDGVVRIGIRSSFHHGGFVVSETRKKRHECMYRYESKFIFMRDDPHIDLYLVRISEFVGDVQE